MGTGSRRTPPFGEGGDHRGYRSLEVYHLLFKAIISEQVRPIRDSRIATIVHPRVVTEPDELIFDWPLLFDIAKDKPVLVTTLACADVLLTLDRRDFGKLIGQTVYGLRVCTPGEFLREERGARQLKL